MRSLGRHACLVLLAAQLSACYSWRTEEVAPAQAIAGSQPEQVRITEPGGKTVAIPLAGVAAVCWMSGC